MLTTFNIRTSGQGLHEFTDEVMRFVRESGVQENADPDVRRVLGGVWQDSSTELLRRILCKAAGRDGASPEHRHQTFIPPTWGRSIRNPTSARVATPPSWRRKGTTWQPRVPLHSGSASSAWSSRCACG